MSEKCIGSTHIQKLSHKIQEIRERALFSIISKLENGFTFDNDLARSRELLSNLFHWFLFDPCTHEERVLHLIRSILQSPSGQVLISHCGKAAIQLEIDKIKSYINPKFHEELDDILNILKTKSLTPNIDVPPLSNDIPLSYRSNGIEDWMLQDESPLVGTTASTIQGLVEKSSSLEQQIGVPQSSKQGSLCSDKPTYRIEKKISTDRTVTYRSNPIYALKWQPLIETDRNVLQSVETSLKNPQDSSMLFHSCEFFIQVLLQDFPAEVFIQRPGIIKIFYEVVCTCRSTKLTNIILQCFYEMTKSLQIRLNHANDPSIQNFKIEMLPNLVSFCGTPASNRNSDSAEPSSSDHFELSDETRILKNVQFSIPDYCFRTINIVLKCMSFKEESLRQHKPKLNQIGVNISLALLDELLNLLYHTLGEDLWEAQQNTEILAIFKDINNTLSLFGDTLEYFRLESLSMDSNLKCRAIYLYLVCIGVKWLKNLIPLSKTKLILPKNFKLSLTNSLLDISLGRLYPKVHKCLLQFVESFGSTTDMNCLKKYEDVMRVCDGLTATVDFLKNSTNISTVDKFELVHAALPSIDFHRNLEFLTEYVDLCSEKLYHYSDNLDVIRIVKDTILHLLAHRLPEIQEEMYKLCHRKVTENVGTKISLPENGINGSEIYFLLDSGILTQIVLFGFKNQQVKRYAEEILLYIIKCKMIVADEIWHKCIEALIPSLSIIICYGDNSSALGRIIINCVDPDTAKNLDFPDIVMLKCNIGLLFTKDSLSRDEAFSRICWLMAKQENSRDILPKFNTIYDKALSNACSVKKVLDVNKLRKTEHFYQPSSLYQVIDLLKSENVEPVIRRSALNQVSVMVDDPLLHDVFLDASGVDLMIDLMKRALQENDFRDYPDSIIPIVSILKTLALYHSSVREGLGLNVNVLYYTLRGLFLFFTDERMRQDASTLIFLLIFKDYLFGSPSKGDFSVPFIFNEKLLVPFISNNHMDVSRHTSEDLFSEIIEDKWSLSSLQIQWNADLHGGFNNLIKIDDTNLLSSNNFDIITNDILTLKSNDLKQIKVSSLNYCIKKYLMTIQSATSHELVEDCVAKLTLYVNFYSISAQLSDNEKDSFLLHPWERSCTRFLEVLPSSDGDIHLLSTIINFLIILVPFYKESDSCWISKFLMNRSHSLLDILSEGNITEEDTKLLSQDLLKLTTLCVIREHHYLDFSVPIGNDDFPHSNWGHIIKIISDNLKYNNSQHFYNLAYLDALLSCLVNLTARLGWSESKPNSLPKEPIPQLISNLCELLTAFHCGKGASATVSVMGLSISRNVLLILNHLLAEIHHFKVRRWEHFFFDNDEIQTTRSFLAMWASRDVILRAAALQLFCNLTLSSKATEEIINDLSHDNGNIWELAITVTTDHTEAGIVRENAAMLLSNLSNHISTNLNSSPSIPLSVSSYNIKQKDPKFDILNLLEEYDFYNHLEIILTSLFTLDYTIRTGKQISSGRSVDSVQISTYDNNEPSEFQINASTPGLVRAVCILLSNMIDLAPKEICGKLQERGLAKMIFKTICFPSVTIDNKKELALYCNILQMNTNVCSLLRKICSLNLSAIGTILHTKDCLNMLFSLLNSKIYYTDLSQLVYLRNKLWSEVFNLIASLLEGSSDEPVSPRNIESLSIISETMSELGIDIFLDVLCESLSGIGTHDLQNSALTILIALLRIECTVSVSKSETESPKNNSIENILDTVRTPKTVLITPFRENIENIKPRMQTSKFTIKNITKHDAYKHNTLKEAYFGKVMKHIRPEQEEEDEIEVSFIENFDDAMIVGGELCKILLFLFELINIKCVGDANVLKKKSLVTAALTGILCISHEAKKYALQKGLMETVVKELRDYHIKLSLESVESLRRVQDKKRICPMLQEIGDLIGLLTNFMLNCDKVKTLAANLNLADVVHKLWIWFCFQNVYITDVLRMLSVYTLDCFEACRSLPLTSPVAGSGPRKTPSNVSLLHSIIALIVKEMEQVSRSHDLHILELAFDILHHCCDLLECRVIISKSNLFQSLSRLHPAVTKRQYPWDSVELLWLEFLQSYTKYSEGQTAVAKTNDVLELIMALTTSNKEPNRHEALMVLRNVTFYQPNRARMLASGDFLNILQSKLSNGSYEEKKTVVAIMWSLAANNQKAKLVFKSAKLDLKLENTIKCATFLGDSKTTIEKEVLHMMYLVLNIIRGPDKVKCSK